MGEAKQLFGKYWVSTTTHPDNSPVKLKVIFGKGKVLSDSPLSNAMSSLTSRFKEKFDDAAQLLNTDHREAVKLLWAIALAGKKQGELCPDAAKEALRHVVLNGSEWVKIGFYSDLLTYSPPQEVLQSAEQKLAFFLFLTEVEISKKPDSISAMAALDCSNALQHALNPSEPANPKAT